MKNWIKEKYQFDIADITTLISVIAVIFTLCGFWWATIIFIINCIINLIYVIAYAKRINLLVLNIALLVFNIYYLF